MTNRQRLWVEKAGKSLAAARLLLDAGNADFAASRAYYAMFYAATALLDTKGLAFKKHSAVIAALGQHFSATGLLPPELHKFIASAENARHIGDYLAEDEPTALDVAVHIERAEQFIRVAESYLTRVNFE